jgi:hypothetical protein
MEKTPGQKREDEVLLRMLNTPPKPHIETKRKGGVIPNATGRRE